MTCLLGARCLGGGARRHREREILKKSASVPRIELDMFILYIHV